MENPPSPSLAVLYLRTSSIVLSAQGPQGPQGPESSSWYHHQPHVQALVNWNHWNVLWPAGNSPMPSVDFQGKQEVGTL